MASADIPITLRSSPPSRDELAAMAMQGLLAGAGPKTQAEPGFVARLARHAYQVADAMLAARAEHASLAEEVVAALKAIVPYAESRAEDLRDIAGGPGDPAVGLAWAAVSRAQAAIRKAEGRSGG